MLSEKQNKIVDLIANKKRNVFVSGPGGTGKTEVIKNIKQLLKDECILLAPTGVASININGKTITSYLKIPPVILDENIKYYDKINFAKIICKRLNNFIIPKTIIIDEVSMIDMDLFEICSLIFQIITNNNKPFGGIQIALFGDFFQLPPYPMNTKKEIRYIFQSKKIWKNLNFIYIELNKSFRQNNSDFTKILNKIRKGKMDNEVSILLLNRMLFNNNIEKDTLHLFSNNLDKDDYNRKCMESIDGKEYIFESIKEENSKYFDNFEHIPDKITLKNNIEIMCLKNTWFNIYNKNGEPGYDKKEKIFNGELGIIKYVSDNKILVEFKRFKNILFKIIKQKFETILLTKEENSNKLIFKPVSCKTQIPIIPLYGSTIHKVQGKTINKKIVIDCKNINNHGEFYVGISRVTNDNDLYIKNFNINNITISDLVKNFYNRLKPS